MSAAVLREAADRLDERIAEGDDLAYDDEWKALAAWLRDAAENEDMQSPGGELQDQWDMRVHIATQNALAVARAILGGAA